MRQATLERTTVGLSHDIWPPFRGIRRVVAEKAERQKIAPVADGEPGMEQIGLFQNLFVYKMQYLIDTVGIWIEN